MFHLINLYLAKTNKQHLLKTIKVFHNLRNQNFFFCRNTNEIGLCNLNFRLNGND